MLTHTTKERLLLLLLSTAGLSAALVVTIMMQPTSQTLTGAVLNPETATVNDVLNELINQGLTSKTSASDILNALNFNDVFRDLASEEVVTLLFQQNRIVGYATPQALLADMERRSIDVAHLRPDGLLTALATASGGSILRVDTTWWDAPLETKNALQNAFENDRLAFLSVLRMDRLLQILDQGSKTSATDDREKFYLYSWRPQRNQATGICPLPAGINGDIGGTGSIICEAKIAITEVNSTNYSDATLRALAIAMKRELDLMPPKHRIAKMLLHQVDGFGGECSTVAGVNYCNGLVDGVYPPGHSKAGQTSEYYLPWMDEWERIVSDRVDRFFREFKAIGGNIDVLRIDIEDKSMGIGEINQRNPFYTGAPSGLTGTGAMMADERWPALQKALAAYGVTDFSGMNKWASTMDPRGVIWNAVMERHRADYIRRAIFDAARRHYPDITFDNYGNFYHSLTLPYGNCSRFTDSCAGIGSIVGSHQSVNLYGYIRNEIMPNESMKARLSNRIRLMSATGGTMAITLQNRANSLRSDQLAIGDRVNLVFTGTCNPDTLTNQLGGTVRARDLIGNGAGMYFGSGEYLVTAINPTTNSFTAARNDVISPVQLADTSCTVNVFTDVLQTATVPSPMDAYNIKHLQTDGSGRLVITFFQAYTHLKIGEKGVLQVPNATGIISDADGRAVDLNPYMCPYIFTSMPNKFTIIAAPDPGAAYQNCASIPPMASRHTFTDVSNSTTISLSTWRSWNAFVSDLRQFRSMLASSTVPVRPWIQHKFVYEAKSGLDVDPNDDADSILAEPYNYFEEAILHILMGMEDDAALHYWVWSKIETVAPNSLVLGNAIAQRAMNEATDIIGFSNRHALTLTPTTWSDDYVLTGVDTGGRKVWRVSPNSLKFGNTGTILSVNPARIRFGTGVIFTMTGARIVLPEHPTISTYGYWLVQDHAPSLLTVHADTAYAMLTGAPTQLVYHVGTGALRLMPGQPFSHVFSAADIGGDPLNSLPVRVNGTIPMNAVIDRRSFSLGTRRGSVYVLHGNASAQDAGMSYDLRIASDRSRPTVLNVNIESGL